MFADLCTQIEAARNLVYRAAYSYDTKSPDLEKMSSVAKIFATDMAVKAALDSIQIHGGGGLMREYSIERMFRDAKTIQNLIEDPLAQHLLLGRYQVGDTVIVDLDPDGKGLSITATEAKTPVEAV